MGYFNPRTEQFYKELPRSKKAEGYVCEVLGGSLTREGDENADVILPNGELIEVKYDKLSKKTNRVAIEYEAYGNERGILRSGADYYFIICYDKDWSQITSGVREDGWWVGILIEKSVLLEMSETIPYKDINGGDNKATKMKLVPVEDIREASIKVFPIKH